MAANEAKVTEAQATQAREAEAAALVAEDAQAPEVTNDGQLPAADEEYIQKTRKPFSSIKPVDMESKIALYNALSGKSEKITDHLGEEIPMQHIAARPIEIVDTETGELIPQWRVTIITPEGKLYSAVSEGIRSSLGEIFDIVGKPPYNPALIVIPIQEATRRGFKVVKFLAKAPDKK